MKEVNTKGNLRASQRGMAIIGLLALGWAFIVLALAFDNALWLGAVACAAVSFSLLIQEHKISLAALSALSLLVPLVVVATIGFN